MGYAEPSGIGPDGKPKWRARWQLPERNEKGRRKEGHKDGFRSEDDARDYARDQEALIRAGLYVDPNAGKIALTDYFELWLSIQRVKPGTRLTYRQYFNREIRPTWGATHLVEIKTVRLMEWLNSLNDPKAPRRLAKSGINLVELILNGVFDLAVYEERLRKSPIPPSSGKRQAGDYLPVREGEIFTRDEFAALLANMPTWKDVVFAITLLFTGKRVSEGAAICRRDLTLHLPTVPGEPIAGTFRVHPELGALKIGEDYKLEAGSPKSGGGNVLDLPPFHVVLLADWLGRFPADRQLLFTAPQGGMLRTNDYNERVWRPACDGREAYSTPHGRRHHPAIPPACPGKVTHDFKHSNKAIMTDGRVPETMQNYALGHKEQGSSAPYKHPTPQMRRERVTALQKCWKAWDIDLTALPAWSAKDGPGGPRPALAAAPDAGQGIALAVLTPALLQAGETTLF